MFAAEDSGELPKGTAMRWAHETPNIKKLPEKKKEKTASLRAPVVDDLVKTSGIMENVIGRLGTRLAPTLVPAAVGAYAAGPEHRYSGAIGGAALGAVGKKLGPQLMGKAMFESPEKLKMMRNYLGSDLAQGSRAYKKIHAALGEGAPEFVKNLTQYSRNVPTAEWGGRVLGGAGGGLAVKELLDAQGPSLQAPRIQSQPAVSDMRSQYYSGLTPDDGMYY